MIANLCPFVRVNTQAALLCAGHSLHLLLAVYTICHAGAPENEEQDMKIRNKDEGEWEEQGRGGN